MSKDDWHDLCNDHTDILKDASHVIWCQKDTFQEQLALGSECKASYIQWQAAAILIDIPSWSSRIHG